MIAIVVIFIVIIAVVIMCIISIIIIIIINIMIIIITIIISIIIIITIIISIIIIIIIIVIVIMGVRSRVRARVNGKSVPFTRAFALQAFGRNCSPAPELVLWKLVFSVSREFFSRGVFSSQTRVSREGCMYRDLEECTAAQGKFYSPCPYVSGVMI